MRIIMYPHNGCTNHGCEAIVRSTIGLLNNNEDDIYLYSTRPESDKAFKLDEICSIIPNFSSKVILSQRQRMRFAIKERLFGLDRDLEELSFRHKPVIANPKNTIALSIGGDNYCYSGMQHVLSEHLKVFYTKCIMGVFTGKNLLDERVLKEYELITVRESESYQILCDFGINKR